MGQIRSETFDCTSQRPAPFRAQKDQKFGCTHNRGFYGSSAFDPTKELKASFRGWNFDNNLVDSVATQRERSFSSYETTSRFVWPAPAFAVLLDTHQNKSVVQVRHPVKANLAVLIPRFSPLGAAE